MLPCENLPLIHEWFLSIQNCDDDQRNQLQAGFRIGILLISCDRMPKQSIYTCIFADCKATFEKATEIIQHLLHCPWFCVGRRYWCHSCGSFHTLKAWTGPDQMHSFNPEPSSISPTVRFESEMSPTSIGYFERFLQDEPLVDQGNRSATGKQRALPKRIDAWLQHKTEICRLYIERCLPLKEVIKEMNERGFEATEKQYKLQFKRWRFRKNLKVHERLQLLREAQQKGSRLLNEDESITFNGVKVSPQRVKRLSRPGKVTESAGFGDLDTLTCQTESDCNSQFDLGSNLPNSEEDILSSWAPVAPILTI